ncbi:GNAT family N-acetyltransferase [Piscirickettsia litoralis]|uniref:GNAT family N-acetyltransferase n=1 Tax=Piscirickettsia litoralis TaxID=1891921 RepID=A0ABX3A5F9_9GAMM|nr:GNAT family N-acetyltransferase [Piscirickettsia litoralis]ODN44087.1 GNAT family N-acetyltransferase [Piscirickettsia litoralis]
MKVLETNRLILRTWQESDLDKMYQINQDSRVMEFFPAKPDRVATEKFIVGANGQLEKLGYTLYAVELKENREFIGFIGLSLAEFESHFTPAVEIGWRLAFDYWNQGYATEGALAVLEHGFMNLNLEKIVSFTAKLNTRSWRVMKKIGLKYDKKDDFYHPNVDKNDKLCLHVLYRLTQVEYLKLKGCDRNRWSYE